MSFLFCFVFLFHWMWNQSDLSAYLCVAGLYHHMAPSLLLAKPEDFCSIRETISPLLFPIKSCWGRVVNFKQAANSLYQHYLCPAFLRYTPLGAEAVTARSWDMSRKLSIEILLSKLIRGHNSSRPLKFTELKLILKLVPKWMDCFANVLLLVLNNFIFGGFYPPA